MLNRNVKIISLKIKAEKKNLTLLPHQLNQNSFSPGYLKTPLHKITVRT